MASFYNHYYNYYRPYYSNNHNTFNNKNYQEKNKAIPTETIKGEKKSNNKECEFHSFGPINFKFPIFNNADEPIFEILGINLFLDDILIIGLLFFLYKEGVQDELLYIVLIMLLIT